MARCTVCLARNVDPPIVIGYNGLEVNMLGTKRGELAVEQPEFKKIEVDVQGGIARAVARAEVIEIKLLMEYDLGGIKLNPGDRVLARAESGLSKWAKNLFKLNDLSFVLMPEAEVIGYRRILRE